MCQGANEPLKILLLLRDRALRLRTKQMESVLGDIKALGRETAASNRELTQVLANEKSAESLGDLRDTLLDRMSAALALFKVTDIAARRSSEEFGLDLWKTVHRVLLIMVKQWENLENLPKLKAELRKLKEPETEALLEYYHKVLRDLVVKSDREYRSYLETVHLLKSPRNAKRLKEAMEDTRKGKVTQWDSVEQLMKSKRG